MQLPQRGDGRKAARKRTFQPCSSSVNRARMDLNQPRWIGSVLMSDVPSGQRLTRGGTAVGPIIKPLFVWSFWPQPDADCALFMAGALQLINALCFVALMMCSDLDFFLLLLFFLWFLPFRAVAGGQDAAF